MIANAKTARTPRPSRIPDKKVAEHALLMLQVEIQMARKTLKNIQQHPKEAIYRVLYYTHVWDIATLVFVLTGRQERTRINEVWDSKVSRYARC